MVAPTLGTHFTKGPLRTKNANFGKGRHHPRHKIGTPSRAQARPACLPQGPCHSFPTKRLISSLPLAFCARHGARGERSRGGNKCGATGAAGRRRPTARHPHPGDSLATPIVASFFVRCFKGGGGPHPGSPLHKSSTWNEKCKLWKRQAPPTLGTHVSAIWLAAENAKCACARENEDAQRA